MQKDFDRWNIRKKAIQRRTFTGFVHEGEIWWCSLGLNIGSEEDGKNRLFERPVLVLKRLNNDMAIILPLTSKPKKGHFYFGLQAARRESSIILSQVRLISIKRFERQLDRISQTTLKRVRENFQAVLKVDID